jgi:hypothetical protein
MSRFTERMMDGWDRVRRLLGFDRMSKTRRQEVLASASFYKRILYFARPALALVFIVYVVTLTARISIIYGDELSYPQQIITDATNRVPPGEPNPDFPGTCGPSKVAMMSSYLLDVLVNQNTWAPGDPQYKIGFFGVMNFAPTPFFDNKASFQIGALRAVRRISIELADLLGRARGTSAADRDLVDARGAVQWNERAWIINPFDGRLPLLSTSAASSYRDAIELFDSFNNRLVQCNALYDSRSDNLFQLLDRIANDVGGMTDQLASRSKGMRWDVASKQMVPGTGNNRGVFDFWADNLFYEAHGMIWAYHGYLQALRADFGVVVRQSNLDAIWDRMETHVAEAAALKPTIVSNGREDSLFQPDHLSGMAANMLRARANMTELREILNR